MQNTTTLETERLILRKITLEDAESMFNNWANDPRVCKYLTWDAHKSIDETKEVINMWINNYQNNYSYQWIVVKKDNNEAIGTIGTVHVNSEHMTADIGYCYGFDYWGKGYATEALIKVLEYLHSEGFPVLICEHYSENIASGRVMQKAGMMYEATLKSRVIDKEGKREDLCIYSSIVENKYFFSKKEVYYGV